MLKKNYFCLIFTLFAMLLSYQPALSKEKKTAPGYEAGVVKKYTPVDLEVIYNPAKVDSSWMAKELGIYDEYNLNVKLKKYDANNNTATLGVVDVVTYLSDAGSGKTDNTPYYVARDGRHDQSLVVRKDLGIKSVKGLAGKKIGLLGLKTVSHLFVLKALKKAGLSDRDVDLVVVSNMELLKLLRDGEVAAIVGFAPWILKPIVEKWGQEILRLSDLFDPKRFKKLVTDIVVVSKATNLVETLDNTSDETAYNDSLVRYLASLEKAAFSTKPNTFSKTEKSKNEVITKALARQTGLGEKILEGLLEQYDARVTKRRLPMTSSLKVWIDEMAELEMLSSKLDVKKLANTKAAKWAGILRRYGVQKW